MSAHRYPLQRYEEMAALRERGWSYGRIAEKMGCSRGAVAWQCLRLGADPPKRRLLPNFKGSSMIARRGNHEVRHFSPAEDYRLLTLEKSGASYTEIAKALGRKRNSVLGRLMTLARRARLRDETKAGAA